MELPSLRQLQYLVALHEHQHFGRAAEACNVTQSTLSTGLKELEAVLRMRLVERTRRVVVFTPVGVGVAHGRGSSCCGPGSSPCSDRRRSPAPCG